MAGHATLDNYINELAQNEAVLIKPARHEPNNQYWQNMLLKNQWQSMEYQHELMQTLLNCHPGTDKDLVSLWNNTAVQYMPPS